MNTADPYVSAAQQLESLAPDITLAILHPDFHGQHQLFAPVLNQTDATLLFAAIPDSATHLPDLLAIIKHELDVQLPNPLPELPPDAEAAASILADRFQARGNIMFILDAYDHTIEEDTAPFISALARRLQPGSRLLVASRELPMRLLEEVELQGKVALVPVNPDRMLLDYAKTGEKTVLEVRALGPGRVLINGRLVEHWDGVLPRTLFFYFVDRGMTTRDEIFQTFWPNLSTREATNVFHVTKRKISEILGTDLTVYWSGFYRISPDLALHYDVIKFAEAVQNAAIASDDEAITLLDNAIALYHGPFLSTMDQSWVEDRRAELATGYAEALAGLARIYQQRDTNLSALGYFLRAAATSPQREDLARAIMELYHQLGQPQEALDTYDRLVDELKSTLNVAPGPQTNELADTIRTSLS